MAAPKKSKLQIQTSPKAKPKRWWEAVPMATRIATGVGAAALLVFGAPVLIPVGLGVGGVAGWQVYKKTRCMTPERKKVYEQALKELKDPKKLRVLADEFQKVGCVEQAEHLRRRAKLRERTPEEAKADRAKYRAALKGKDAAGIQRLAVYFKGIGADGTAANLMKRVTALKAVA